MQKLLGLLVLAALPVLTWSQAKTRRLPGIINHPSFNIYTPYISHDGNALLFISDNAEDNQLALFYTSRENDWIEPVAVPKNVYHRLTFLRGFSLTADGRKMYYTSTKSPIIGGYDIVMSELKGSTWTEPQNLMIPINSKTNEGCPSLTTDGNTIYFMRCDKMDPNKASGCRLFKSTKKPNGQWEEPVELPANINTGNSQTPRIMADGATLIFSSDKMPGNKGGMDLYVSKLVNNTWSDPLPMDFVNSEKDDQYVSAAALGRYLIKEAPGPRKTSELVEYLIPDNLRPKGMMKIEGKITDAANAPVTAAYVEAIDLKTNKRIYSGRPNADGTYMLYVMEGTQYAVSIDPEQSSMTYVSKQYDLTTDKIPQRERLNAVLKPAAAGDELSLDQLRFKPNSSDLDQATASDLKRLVRLAKATPNLKWEIQVMLKGFEQDSVQSNPDLTEISIDSVHRQVTVLDSLGQPQKRDTVVAKKTYHNDRTLQQAQRIIDYLATQGADATRFTTFGNAIPAVNNEPKKLVVKAVARSK